MICVVVVLSVKNDNLLLLIPGIIAFDGLSIFISLIVPLGSST